MIDPRSVLDALPSAVVVTDLDDRILLWNRAAEILYGWVEHEVLGRSFSEVLPPGHGIGIDSGPDEAVGASPASRVVGDRNGTLRRVHTVSASMLDTTGALVATVSTSHPVQELRSPEQQTRDLTDQYRLALHAGRLGTWRWDMASDETLWDERLESLFGIGPEEFDGSFATYLSMIHPDDRARVLADVDEAVKARSTYQIQHRVVWPDGSIHWIEGVGGVTLDDHGEVTGTVGCTMDITERVELELERHRLAEIAVRAADEQRIQRERLEFLSQINEALNASTTVREVMVNVTSSAVPRLGDWCFIHILHDPRLRPDVEVAHTDPTMVALARELQDRFPYDPDGPSGVPAVIRTGATEFYPDISDEVLASLETSADAVELVKELDLRSAITVAMKKRGRVVGALQFVRTSQSRRYTADDVALAETLAGRIASSIENLRLQDQQRQIAQTLQRSLLPTALPDVPGIDAAVRYWPNGAATEVGGDFYDVFALEHGDAFAVVLGDVCGTGPSAAALTGLARHTIRDSAWHGDDHEAVLRSLNKAVRRSGTNTFLTCLYATIDTTGAGAAITISSGGHPLPVLVNRTAAATIGAFGTLLGAFDDIVVRSTTIELLLGDVVVFHTDGVTDVPPPHGLSDSEWVDIVAAAVNQGGTADDIAGHIGLAIEAVLPFTSRNDDIALLVLSATAGRRSPSVPPTTRENRSWGR